MVDEAVLTRSVADIRDAVARIREVLPADVEDFERDRTTREVVALNLFVSLQQALSLAAHWLAAEGRVAPTGYRAVFRALAEGAVLDRDLAERLARAAGLRNIIAHRYGQLDWRTIHAIASSDLDDLLSFCRQLAAKA